MIGGRFCLPFLNCLKISFLLQDTMKAVLICPILLYSAFFDFTVNEELLVKCRRYFGLLCLGGIAEEHDQHINAADHEQPHEHGLKDLIHVVIITTTALLIEFGR